MKKIKCVCFAAAILFSIVTTLSSAKCYSCESFAQYYFDGANYVYAGRFGYDYICLVSPGVCTYYKPNPATQPFYYAPCMEGQYISAVLTDKKPQ
jgi:hypothetical protein